MIYRYLKKQHFYLFLVLFFVLKMSGFGQEKRLENNVRIIFIDNYYNNVDLKKVYPTYILLLEILETDTCFKYMTANYSGDFKIETNCKYKIVYEEIKNKLVYSEEIRNDTIIITGIKCFHKRRVCQPMILNDPITYDTYFSIISISEIN